MALMFKFISGKYKGGEFPLDKNVIVIGRHSDLEMVLSEDMVSRKHAKISISGSDIILEDMGSTNGTFVNGNRIKKIKLKLNDRILIGTSIAKFIDSDDTGQNMEDAAKIGTNAVSGSIEDIPIPEVLQLLATSKKTGVLRITSGSISAEIQLVQGIFKDIIMTSSNAEPKKILIKLIKLDSGFFEFEQKDPSDFGNRLNISLDAFLLEAAKYEDEVGLDDLDFELEEDDDDLMLDSFDEISVNVDDSEDILSLDDFNDENIDAEDDIFALDDLEDDDFALDDLDDDAQETAKPKNDDFNLDDLDDDDNDFALDDLDDVPKEIISEHDSLPNKLSEENSNAVSSDLVEEENKTEINIDELKEKFPLDDEYILPLPLFSPLDELNKNELKVLQLVHNFSSISEIIENTELSEEETYAILDKLVEEDYIEQ